MAVKFCMFCGKELPHDALFCQFCGKEQSKLNTSSDEEKEQREASENVTDVSEVVEDTKDDEDITPEMKLLIQAGILAKEEKRKEEEKKVNNSSKYIAPPDPDTQVIKLQLKTIPKSIQKPLAETEEKETIPVEESKKEAWEPEIIEDPVAKTVEEVQQEDFDLLDENGDEEYHSTALHDFNASDYDEEDTDDEFEELEEMFDILDGKSSPIPTMVSDIESTIKQEALDLSKEEEKEESSDKPGWMKRKVKVPDKKISTDEELEGEVDYSSVRSHQKSGFNYDETSDMTEDEKVDYEKEQRQKEADKEKKVKSTVGEGRKANGRKRSIRENVDKLIDARKLEDIEQEEVAKKDIDPDYDGYYENVKPIDFDKQVDNSASIKVALVGVSIIAALSVAFYLLFTFFMA